MSTGLRLTEQWMRRALWLVAFAFAGFLIGLGGKIVDNLIWVAPPPTAEQFLDPAKAGPLQTQVEHAQKAREVASDALAQAQQKHNVAVANTRSARDTFDNWIATRHATLRPDQDPELIQRTRALDDLAAVERTALAAVELQQQAELDAKQTERAADSAYNDLWAPARDAAQVAAVRAERNVFLVRLAVTLPLLLVAGWLFKHKRKGTYWPFTWGFIFFALFAFFVELVPYLPSYGGYVRYGVGIVVTVVVGRYAIRWLHAWLARQKEAEALPDATRRTSMRYDVAIDRVSKSICPSCERAINFKDETMAHCPHCGISVFDHCLACRTRKNAFTRFCFSCGTPANVSLAD